ncbi:MAG: glycosyltransferase family 4 protein [Paracoccaceae bacterium]
MMARKKILYLLTEDWFFCSHFIERATATQAAGYEVVIVAREREHGERIRAAGLRFIGLEFERRSMNLQTELRQFWQILKLYRHERPDLVHQVSHKPILYGTVAALITGVPAIVNAPVGMGYIFSSEDWRARLLRPFVCMAYRFLANPRRSRVIFENGDDLKIFVNWGAVRASDAVLIRGAGVDLNRFRPVARKNPTPVIALVGRMLRDKGVNEYVTAAHQLHDEGVVARFLLVGAPDPINPSSIPSKTLEAWHGRKGLEWLGWCEDIPRLLEKIDVMCLPSYREGLPKSLIEAAACGLPIVTTDTPGCREVVRHGDNGFLVAVGDIQQLAEVLKQLIQDPEMRHRMGSSGAEIAAKEFSSDLVIAETLSLYEKLPHLGNGIMSVDRQ